MTGQLNTAMCLEGLNRRGGGGGRPGNIPNIPQTHGEMREVSHQRNKKEKGRGNEKNGMTLDSG